MEENKKAEKEIASDPKFCILLLQIATTVLLLLGMLGLKISKSDLYKTVRTEYYKMANDVTAVDEVLKGQEKAEENTASLESTVSETVSSEEAEMEESTILDENTDIAEPSDSTATGVGLDLKAVQTSLSTDVSKAQSIIWPLKSYKKTSNYGYRKDPFTSKTAFHHGLDLAADKGTPIYAVMDGTVSAVGVGKSYGNYILVRHSSNMSTLYAHCSKIVAKQGQKVEQGDTVALVGSTGRSTGNHLHFEIRIGSNRVDPLWLLP